MDDDITEGKVSGQTLQRIEDWGGGEIRSRPEETWYKYK